MRRGTFVSSIAMLALVWASTAGLAQSLPASGDDATARLAESPRHGEWVKYDAGGGDSVMAWVVYPERSERAPVVVVIHEIGGLTDWIRSGLHRHRPRPVERQGTGRRWSGFVRAGDGPAGDP